MAVKLKVKRSKWISVPIQDEDGNFVNIQVNIAIPKPQPEADKDKSKEQDEPPFSELILDVRDLELSDEETGRVLTHDEMVESVKGNIDMVSLIVNAWVLGKKQLVQKQKTFLESQES